MNIVPVVCNPNVYISVCHSNTEKPKPTQPATQMSSMSTPKPDGTSQSATKSTVTRGDATENMEVSPSFSDLMNKDKFLQIPEDVKERMVSVDVKKGADSITLSGEVGSRP